MLNKRGSKTEPCGTRVIKGVLLKTVKPVFSNEIQTSSSVTLIEDGKMTTDDAKIAEIFNHYFANITESLGISEDQSLLSPTTGINDPIEKATKKYEDHPSIKMIKERCELSQFEFKPVTFNDMLLQIQKLNTNMSSPLNSILAKIIKHNADIFPSSSRKSSILICQSAIFQRI